VTIDIEHFSYTYPKCMGPALNDISLSIADGTFFGVIGANGSGKSTLCRALIGFVPHFYHGSALGAIRVNGYSVGEGSISDLAQTVGFVFQNPFDQLTGIAETCFDEVSFGLEQRGIPAPEIMLRVEEALTDVGLADKASRHPFYLSGGQQQRLAIAAVLALHPQVLVLDEATSQLDPAGTEEIFGLARRLHATGRTIIMVEHKLDKFAQHAEQIGVLHRGELVATGPCESILTDPRLPSWNLRPPDFVTLGVRLSDLGFPVDPIPTTLTQAESQLRALIA